MTRRIYIDGDACSLDTRELAERLGNRGVEVVIVANRAIPITNEHSKMVQTDSSKDAVDTYIAEHAVPQDLVITKDLLLAKTLLMQTKGNILIISDLGERYTSDIIDARLVRAEHAKQRRNFGDVPLLQESNRVHTSVRNKSLGKQSSKAANKVHNKIAGILESWRIYKL